uniref:FTH domain-containing protein n=1 Tax=Caenorhabditis tropicalis TaxID=1561998 RepID=A0A1I7T2V2_9PELO
MSTPAKYGLEQMPDTVLEKILGYSDWPAIQSLRKTCHFFYSLNPPKIRDFRIQMPTFESIQITIGLEGHPPRVIHYNKNGNNCEIVWNSRRRRVSEGFLEVFFMDFEGVRFSMIKNFGVWFHPEDVRFPESMEKILKLRPLKIENLTLEVHDNLQILSILPYTSPTAISISGQETYINLDTVVNLNSWKNAKEIEILWVTVGVPVEEFLHFSIVNVQKFGRLDAKEVVLVKEKFLTSPTPIHYNLGYNHFTDDNNLLDTVFGDPDTCEDDTGFMEKRWYFSIPNEEKVLEIEFCNEFVLFRRIEIEEVPEKRINL